MESSPKRKYLDDWTNSLKKYHKKCMENNVENMHVDSETYFALDGFLTQGL